MPRLPHDFAAEPNHRITLQAHAFLALVDLETYPAFIAAKADHLDLLQHLCRQMEALTATMWEVPAGEVTLQLHWQADDPRHAASGILPIASGNIRTSGRLALLNDESLLAAAQNLHGSLTQQPGVHILHLPAGIYAVSVHNAPTHPAALTYAVTLNHHPHPPPRLQPIRLGGLARPLTSYLTPDSSTRDAPASHKLPR
jgi:hypothetical protein